MSTYQLLVDTLAEGIDFGRLLLKLARAELLDQAAKVRRGSISAVVAVVILLIAIIFLLLGIVDFIISLGVAAYLGFFIVAAALAAIGLLFVLLAWLNLKHVNLRPNRTLDQIQRFSLESQRSHDDAL